MSPAEPALVLRHGAEGIPRRDDAWEGYGDIGTELIGINLTGTAALSGDSLPLMCSMKVDIQLLSSPEGIALG